MSIVPALEPDQAGTKRIVCVPLHLDDPANRPEPLNHLGHLPHLGHLRSQPDLPLHLSLQRSAVRPSRTNRSHQRRTKRSTGTRPSRRSSHSRRLGHLISRSADLRFGAAPPAQSKAHKPGETAAPTRWTGSSQDGRTQLTITPSQDGRTGIRPDRHARTNLP